jgi:hypothetical protein
MGSAFGAGAGADALQEILRQKFTEAMAQQAAKAEQQRIAIAQQSADDNSAYRHMQQTSLDEDRKARQQAQAQLGAERFASTTPMGSQLGPDALSRLAAGGMTGPEFVQHKDATLGSTNLSGAVSSGDAGPGIGEAPRITRIARTANPGHAESNTFLGTSGQKAVEQARQDAIAKREADAQAKIDAAAQGKTDKEDLLRVAAGLRPAPQGAQGHFSLVPGTGPDGKPVMFRVNAQTGDAQIVDAGGGSLGKGSGSGVNATTENRLQSAKAVTQTGNDIVSMLKDPKVAAQLGQAMSRYNNVADFIGNAPPEWSNLAGMIESYSLANMGVHGMRSASGAEAIKGTLGQGRHTPESMIAAIQGLNGFSNHLLENNAGWDKKQGGPAAAGGGPAPKKIRYDINGKQIQD